LPKLARAWEQLIQDETPVDLALLSSRSPAAGDPLICLRVRSFWCRRRLGRAALQGRARWAERSGLSEERLLELLTVPRFDLARDCR
jgi:hypothetical protein